MDFELNYLPNADQALTDLEKNPATKKKAKRIRQALRFLAHDPQHSSLRTHEFRSESGPKGEKMFEAHAENKTSRAWRILFYYPKGELRRITIYALIPHPD